MPGKQAGTDDFLTLRLPVFTAILIPRGPAARNPNAAAQGR
jgi:hypothetical protein